jgi:hypothetical protein
MIPAVGGLAMHREVHTASTTGERPMSMSSTSVTASSEGDGRLAYRIALAIFTPSALDRVR